VNFFTIVLHIGLNVNTLYLYNPQSGWDYMTRSRARPGARPGVVCLGVGDDPEYGSKAQSGSSRSPTQVVPGVRPVYRADYCDKLVFSQTMTLVNDLSTYC
jgi:hypothetical protein